MSSSTSNSDAASAAPPQVGQSDAWRGFSVRALIVAVCVGLALFAGFIALDPYDTGQLSLTRKHGVLIAGNRLGDVSRLHDEGFDSAIFGNSHILPVSSTRLSAATGLSVMTLAIPGTGVAEQMAMLDAYLARHSTPRALILAVDWVYCLDEPVFNPPQEFPDWLYTPNRLAYATALFQMRTIGIAARRIAFLLGWVKPLPRDGAMDIYEGHRKTEAEATAYINSLPREDFSSPPQTRMPAFTMLAERLDRMSPDTAVVLVLPPVAAAWLPQPGTPAAASVQACKDRAFALAKGRPKVRVVDWHRATPETSEIRNFWDPSHFYDPVAIAVERDIAAALGDLGVRKP